MSTEVKYTFEGQAVASIHKISEWTWGAYSEDDVKLTSAPSKTKLIEKLTVVDNHSQPVQEPTLVEAGNPEAIYPAAKVKKPRRDKTSAERVDEMLTAIDNHSQPAGLLINNRVPKKIKRETLVEDKKPTAKKRRADVIAKAQDGLKRKGLDKKPKLEKKAKSIKTMAIELISGGYNDDDIIVTIKLEYPDSKFDQSHVSWYRSTLFRDGIIGPEHAPRRSKEYKNWLNANLKNDKPAKIKAKLGK